MPLTVGTAGHIDHGKTWLVRALTGKDTDRLPEEQRRGISIDLGYAPLELADGRRLSLIDERGERYVRMAHLATVGSHAVNGVAALHSDLLKQTVLRDFTLLPLVAGVAPPTDVADVLDRLWGGDETAIVISTDLSHFLSYDAAQRREAAGVALGQLLEPRGLEQGPSLDERRLVGDVGLVEGRRLGKRILLE